MTNKQQKTTASISIEEFGRICNNVDREFEEYFGDAFAQRRTYAKAAAYVDALADPLLARKTAWQIAEHAEFETPRQIQSLTGENKWCSEEIWDRVSVKAATAVGAGSENNPFGLAVIFDETADGKRGRETCGVGYQYAGCAGGVINCVTWVMASFIGPEGKTWASARLYLPEKDWFTGDGTAGAARRKKAGIPDDIVFESKPKLALKQLRHFRELGISIGFGGGDEVYGRSAELREDHEKNGEAYAYFVPRDHIVETHGKECRRVDELLELSAVKFEARSSGPGVNGPRFYEWGMIGLKSENHFLLLRKPARADKQHAVENETESSSIAREAARASKPEEAGDSGGNNQEMDFIKESGITFCLCFIPPGSPISPTLANLVLMSGSRWGVEETMATGKGPVGWDENQSRKWESLQHHTALTGMAMLKANIIRQLVETAGTDDGEAAGNYVAIKGEEPGKPGQASAGTNHYNGGEDLMIPVGDSLVPRFPGQPMPDEIGFARLSMVEVLRLKSIIQSDISNARKSFHLRWSKWRRKHQAVARWHHHMARMKEAENIPAPSMATTIGSQPDDARRDDNPPSMAA